MKKDVVKILIAFVLFLIALFVPFENVWFSRRYFCCELFDCWL